MKNYTVTINGVEHTLQLSDDDAKRRGLTAVDEVGAKKAEAPANKARKVANKAKD